MDSLITTTIDTPEYIQQTLDQHFTDVDVASEIAEFGGTKDTRVCAIVEIENDIKAAIVIMNPHYLSDLFRVTFPSSSPQKKGFDYRTRMLSKRSRLGRWVMTQKP